MKLASDSHTPIWCMQCIIVWNNTTLIDSDYKPECLMLLERIPSMMEVALTHKQPNTVLLMCPSNKKIWSQWFYTALYHQLLKIYFPGCFEKSCQRDALASYCKGAATWPLLPTTQLDCFTALEPASGFWPEISCAKNTLSFLMIESIFARVMQMQMLSFLPCHLPGKWEDTRGKPPLKSAHLFEFCPNSFWIELNILLLRLKLVDQLQWGLAA